jgi:hypothetical protein
VTDRPATALLLTLLAAAVLGAAQSWIAANTNTWKERLLSGETITVKLICGAEHSLSCERDYQLRYTFDPLCEHVSIDGGPDQTGWCNADPASGQFSVTGAIFEFDRFGEVRRGSKLAGQLFLVPSP